MKIAVISDTHAKEWEDTPEVFRTAVVSADAVIHAGDIGTSGFYDVLKSKSKHLYAVLGNNDRLSLPWDIEIELEGVKIAVTHGDVPSSSDRENWLLYTFPNARLIIYGHSHSPFLLETGTQTLLNPGSVKRNRTVDYRSFVLLTLKNGAFDIEFIKLIK